jgi:hypothetical protein
MSAKIIKFPTWRTAKPARITEADGLTDALAERNAAEHYKRKLNDMYDELKKRKAEGYDYNKDFVNYVSVIALTKEMQIDGD